MRSPGPSLAATALLLLLSACGNPGAPESSEDAGTDSDADTGSSVFPACTDVWVDGGDLPTDYRGCTEADGTEDQPSVITCDSGGREFATYDDAFFGELGGTITEAATDSDEYVAAYEDCVDG